MNSKKAMPVFKYILMLLLALSLSCSEEIKPTPYTYTEIFSGKNSKTWVFKSIVLWQEGKSDITYTLPACVRDDRYIFYADAEKKYEVANGPTKCSGDEPDVIVSDTWAFINAGATMTIIIPFLADFNLPYIVRSVSKNSMVLEIFLDFDGKESYRISFDSISEN